MWTCAWKGPVSSNTWEVRKIPQGRHDAVGGRNAKAIKRAQGDVVVLIACEDITVRRRAEEAARESAKRFRALIEHAFDVVLLLDRDYGVLYASPSVERVLGYAPRELVGRNGLDLIHSDQIEDARKQFAAAWSAKAPSSRASGSFNISYGRWLWIENTDDEFARGAERARLRCEPPGYHRPQAVGGGAPRERAAVSHLRRSRDGRLLPRSTTIRPFSTSTGRPARALGFSREETRSAMRPQVTSTPAWTRRRSNGAGGARSVPGKRSHLETRASAQGRQPSFPVEVRATPVRAGSGTVPPGVWGATSPSAGGRRTSCARARSAFAAWSITRRMVSSCWTRTRPFSTSTGRPARAWVTAVSEMIGRRTRATSTPAWTRH